MTNPVTLPVWLFVLICLFAVASFATNFLFPSVRWFFRRRAEKAVALLNTKLERPIEPFKLLERQDLIQRLVYHPEVTQAIVDHAYEENVREDVAFEKARQYAREIVPAFSALTYFGWGVWLARLLSNALYRVRLGYHDPQELAGIDPEATVVFVINHRSNMDYVLVTHLASEQSALSYAVGEWAQVWPLSRLIRSMGAYFIRRRSRDNLYRKVLRRYVHMSTEGGVTQAIFPEGGLSLTGALTPPKLGLLSYITDGLEGFDRNVVFVPVALNYDRVLEDHVLIRAHQSGRRKFDASILQAVKAVIKQVWLRITGRFHKFGYAAVSFGSPLQLKDHPALADDPKALARVLMQRIADIVPVLSVPLVSYLLDQGADTPEKLRADFEAALKHLKGSHVHLPHDDVGYAIKYGVRVLVERKILIEDEGRYAVQQPEVIKFYANSIAHLM
jgi:glycerol-3-phosphate O-acyltransferase